jgi:hypothetical protein
MYSQFVSKSRRDLADAQPLVPTDSIQGGDAVPHVLPTKGPRTSQ